MAELFVIIVVVLIAARFTGELMERFGQLALLGELLAGIVLGVLITYGPFPHIGELVQNEAFRAIDSLGMFFLMLMAGMEMDVRELAKASKTGIIIAVGGIVLPLSLGYLLGQIFIPESEYKFVQSFFIGVALSITAVPAMSRVLIDLKLLNTRLGYTIMSAAIIDDIIGLFLLAVLASLVVQGGSPSGGEIVLLAAKIVGFFAVALIIGLFVMPQMARVFDKLKSREIEFSIFLIIALALGVIAEYAGMHFIVGALVAGLFIREGTFESKTITNLHTKISGIALGFLAPIFFVSIGFHVDFSALGTVPLFTLALLGVAIVGKILGCGLLARLTKFSMRESFAIGIGMNGRGAVELIVAAVALDAGLFNYPVPVPTIVTAIFSSVVIMAIITTIMVPLGIKPLLVGDQG